MRGYDLSLIFIKIEVPCGHSPGSSHAIACASSGRLVFCLIGFAAQMIVDSLPKNLAANKEHAMPNTKRPSRTKMIDAPFGATDKASR